MPTRDLRSVLTGLLGEQSLVIADVGAAYGLPAHLRVLDGVATICFFEPHPERAKELSESYEGRGLGSRVRVCPVALSATNGPRTLYVTNVPTGSSLLRPGSEAGLNLVAPEYFFPVREVEVHTRRLEDVLKDEGLPRLDFIKLDVQGGELEVLHGLGSEHTANILGVELEVGFPGGYVNQPSFSDLNKYLESHELVLFDLKPARWHRPLPRARLGYAEDVFGVVSSAPSLSRRLWEADAIYFRSTKELLSNKDLTGIRRLILLYCSYGFFTEADYLITQVRNESLASDDEIRHLKAGVLSWHRYGRYCFTDSLVWKELTGSIFSFARKVGHRLCRRRVAGWLDY